MRQLEDNIRDMAYPAVLPRKIITVLASKFHEIEDRYRHEVGPYNNVPSRSVVLPVKEATDAQKKVARAFLRAKKAYDAARTALDKAHMYEPSADAKGRMRTVMVKLTEQEFQDAVAKNEAERKKLYARKEAALQELGKLVRDIAAEQVKKVEKSLPEPIRARLDTVTQTQVAGLLPAQTGEPEREPDAEIVIPEEGE